MRVVMIIQAYYPHVGGAERQIAALAPLLQHRGVDLLVLTRRYSGLAARERVGGLPVVRLPIPGPKALAALVFSLSALPAIWRFHPDVIHAHELLSPATTALLAKRIFGLPVVVKVLRGGSLGDIAKLKNRLMGYRRIAALRQNVDRFITISQEIDAELAAVGVPASQRVAIPNGVDTDHFKPLGLAEKASLREKLGWRAGPVVLFAGRLVSEKRIDLLLAAWESVSAQFPTARLVILGSGEQAAALQNLGVANVLFQGNVAEVAPYLQAADIFVLPSATEGLSNALLEAMSAGLAVVATAVGGAPDVIQADHSGLLIPPDDANAIQAALIALLTDPVRRRLFGQNARQQIEQAYSLTQTADRLHDLYTEVLVNQ